MMCKEHDLLPEEREKEEFLQHLTFNKHEIEELVKEICYRVFDTCSYVPLDILQFAAKVKKVSAFLEKAKELLPGSYCRFFGSDLDIAIDRLETINAHIFNMLDQHKAFFSANLHIDGVVGQILEFTIEFRRSMQEIFKAMENRL